MTDYQSSRTSVRSGDIVAFCGTGLGARIIRWWTGSPWTHVGIACWWKGRLMILESYPGKGTRAHPLSHDLPCYIRPMGVVWTEQLHKEATELLDLPYSWLNDWKAAWGMRLVERRKQCAQYVRDILERAGVQGLPMSPTPGNLMTATNGNGGFWFDAA